MKKLVLKPDPLRLKNLFLSCHSVHRSYLLSYDAVTFSSYIDTIIASNSTSRGTAKQNQSPWLFLDAANVLFQAAKKRLYVIKEPEPEIRTLNRREGRVQESTDGEDEEDGVQDGTEEEWEAVRSTEAMTGERSSRPESGIGREGNASANAHAHAHAHAHAQGRNRKRSTWPNDIQPVLEEQPKWHLLSQVLDEIESEITYGPLKDVSPDSPGNNTVLVMCDSDRNCAQLREYLSLRKPVAVGKGDEGKNKDDEENNPGRIMMERYLRNYLYWKSSLRGDHRTAAAIARGQAEDNAAQRDRDRDREGSSSGYTRGGRPPPNKRRRMRGGAFTANASERNKNKRQDGEKEIAGERELEREAEEIAEAIRRKRRSRPVGTGYFGSDDEFDDDDDDEQLREVSEIPSHTAHAMLAPSKQATTTDLFSETAFEEYFGLIPLEDVVIIRPYGGDEDDLVLQELRPRFVVMYDPDPAFIRRIEVYRGCNPGLGVRMYFMMYADSVEEQRYLAGLRKEKDAFERLIKEKGVSLAVLFMDVPANGKINQPRASLSFITLRR